MFEEYTTVQEAADGDIILVGEEHFNQDSASLARRVLDKYQPETVAAERTPLQSVPPLGAMGEVRGYGKRAGAPLIKVDNIHWFSGEIIDDGNIFTHPIQENGDLNPQAITDARSRIRDTYGQRAYDEMYPEREQAMAARLSWAAEAFPLPQVCALGTFHILAVRDLIGEVEPQECGSERIERFTEDSCQTICQTT